MGMERGFALFLSSPIRRNVTYPIWGQWYVIGYLVHMPKKRKKKID